MAAIGGSIESITINGRIFAVAADADVSRKLGGFENEVLANGSGTARLIKTRMVWSLADITVEIDDSRSDHAFLQDLANENDFFSVGITYASGEIFQGTGQISDELTASSQSATATLSMSGPGVLSKQ